MTSKILPLRTNGHTGLWHKDTLLVTDFGKGLPFFSVHTLFTCKKCGAYADAEIADDAVLVTNPCTAPAEGYTTVIRLNVPSGKLVFTDDLRPLYDGFNEDFATYNSDLGVSQVIQAFAEQGCAFGFVGDAWPDLYQTGEGTYVLAKTEWDEETDDRTTPDGWTRLADGGGDLWAYSIADYDDWQARGGKPEMLKWTGTVVEIPAGTYEFTYHGGENGFDRHSLETVIFTDIKKVA